MGREDLRSASAVPYVICHGMRGQALKVDEVFTPELHHPEVVLQHVLFHVGTHVTPPFALTSKPA